MMNDLANRIQSRLDALGKNPSGVALEAGLGRSSVRDILLGRVGHPRIDTLRKLTGPLECTLDYLTGESDKPEEDGIYRRLIEYDVSSDILPFVAEAGVFRPVQKSDESRAERAKRFAGRTYHYSRDPRLPDWDYALFEIADSSMADLAILKGDILTVVHRDRYDVQLPLTEGALVAVRRALPDVEIEETSIRQIKIQAKSILLTCRAPHAPSPIEIKESLVDNESRLLPNFYPTDKGAVEILGIVIKVERQIEISQAVDDLTYVRD